MQIEPTFMERFRLYLQRLYTPMLMGVNTWKEMRKIQVDSPLSEYQLLVDDELIWAELRR